MPQYLLSLFTTYSSTTSIFSSCNISSSAAGKYFLFLQSFSVLLPPRVSQKYLVIFVGWTWTWRGYDRSLERLEERNATRVSFSHKTHEFSTYMQEFQTACSAVLKLFKLIDRLRIGRFPITVSQSISIFSCYDQKCRQEFASIWLTVLTTATTWPVRPG